MASGQDPRWKDEYTIPFLESYRRHECLWNTLLADYKNQTMRRRAIESMIEDLRPLMSKEDLHLLTEKSLGFKIKSLRSSYHKELKKIEQSEKSGAGVLDVYKPRLFWFELADSFLRKSCRPTPSSSNLGVSIAFYGFLTRPLDPLRSPSCAMRTCSTFVTADQPSVISVRETYFSPLTGVRQLAIDSEGSGHRSLRRV